MPSTMFLAFGDAIEEYTDIALSKDEFTNAAVGHILPCKRSDNARRIVLHVNNIRESVFEVDYGLNDLYFICLLPNRFEMD